MMLRNHMSRVTAPGLKAIQFVDKTGDFIKSQRASWPLEAAQ